MLYERSFVYYQHGFHIGFELCGFFWPHKKSLRSVEVAKEEQKKTVSDDNWYKYAVYINNNNNKEET